MKFPPNRRMRSLEIIMAGRPRWTWVLSNTKDRAEWWETISCGLWSSMDCFFFACFPYKPCILPSMFEYVCVCVNYIYDCCDLFFLLWMEFLHNQPVTGIKFTDIQLDRYNRQQVQKGPVKVDFSGGSRSPESEGLNLQNHWRKCCNTWFFVVSMFNLFVLLGLHMSNMCVVLILGLQNYMSLPLLRIFLQNLVNLLISHGNMQRSLHGSLHVTSTTTFLTFFRLDRKRYSSNSVSFDVKWDDSLFWRQRGNSQKLWFWINMILGPCI